MATDHIWQAVGTNMCLIKFISPVIFHEFSLESDRDNKEIFVKERT